MNRFIAITPWFSRAVLLMATVVLTGISLKYMVDPVRTSAESGISLTTPLALTNIRIGFGAFPLGFALITLACLILPQQRFLGLSLVATLIGVALAVRIYGVLVDGTLARSMFVLRAETILFTLSLIGIFAEQSFRRQGRPSSMAGSAISTGA